MSNVPDETGNQQTPYAGKGCPKCGYDLTGTLEPRCPECGTAFDPGELRAVGFKRRVSWRLTAPCVLMAMYLPNTWVFWIDYPWNEYRMIWVKHIIFLPSLVPGTWLLSWLTGNQDGHGYLFNVSVLSVILLILISISCWQGRRTRWRLILVCILLFGFEVFNAYVSHALFRM